MRGQLRDEGWGAELGYPGLRLDDNGEQVDGFVFTSDQLSQHWEELDLFEGEAYKRVLSNVRLADGSQTKAYIYALREP